MKPNALIGCVAAALLVGLQPALAIAHPVAVPDDAHIASALEDSFPAPLSLDELDAARGAQDANLTYALAGQRLTAVNAGNSVAAESVVSGAVSIGERAFTGFSGLGNFVFNTGNNNNIQGALNVMVVIPAPMVPGAP